MPALTPCTRFAGMKGRKSRSRTSVHRNLRCQDLWWMVDGLQLVSLVCIFLYSIHLWRALSFHININLHALLKTTSPLHWVTRLQSIDCFHYKYLDNKLAIRRSRNNVSHLQSWICFFRFDGIIPQKSFEGCLHWQELCVCIIFHSSVGPLILCSIALSISNCMKLTIGHQRPHHRAQQLQTQTTILLPQTPLYDPPTRRRPSHQTQRCGFTL